MLKDKVVVITGGVGRIAKFAKSVENSGIAIIADINEDFANKTKRISKELEEKILIFHRKILFLI